MDPAKVQFSVVTDYRAKIMFVQAILCLFRAGIIVCFTPFCCAGLTILSCSNVSHEMPSEDKDHIKQGTMKVKAVDINPLFPLCTHTFHLRSAAPGRLGPAAPRAVIGLQWKVPLLHCESAWGASHRNLGISPHPFSPRCSRGVARGQFCL